jgi:hypothetical protein
MSKQLQRKVYEGDVIQSVKVLGVTLKADAETVARYEASLAQVKQALARLKVATRVWQRPDERNVIDQE